MPSPNAAIFLPSLEGGGAERVFVQLANETVRRGVSVDLVLASVHGPYLDELGGAVRVVDLRASGVLSSLPRLIRYLRAEQPEVMLSALDHANVIAILACGIAHSKTRCVVSVRSVPTAVYRYDRSISRWIMLRLAGIAYRFADRIVANSQAAAADLTQSLRIPKSRIGVIYNPVDVERIVEMSYELIDEPWLDFETSPIILSVGSLAVLKDFPTLITAFSIVRAERNCRLVILGDGPDRGKLESLIHRLRLQQDVYLPGFVSNPFRWLRLATVFVSSSLTESCPNALMQALACGTPVVSTDCAGGSAEILEHGKWGRLVPVGDAVAMADALLATLESADHPDVRKRASDFAVDDISRQYLSTLFPDELPSMRKGS